MSSSTRIPVTSATLASIRIFRSVPAGVREQIAAGLHAQRFERESVIIKQFEDESDVYFIVSGTVRVTFFSESGKEVLFRDLSAGDIVGELSALDAGPRSAEVWAFSEVVLIAMGPDQFRQLFMEYPDVLDQVMRHLVTSVRELTARIVELSTLGVKKRVDNELLRLARANSDANGTGAVIRDIHDDIAKKVSTTREAVTKEISELTRLQVIQEKSSKSGPIVIPDIRKLENIVHPQLDDTIGR